MEWWPAQGTLGNREVVLAGLTMFCVLLSARLYFQDLAVTVLTSIIYTSPKSAKQFSLKSVSALGSESGEYIASDTHMYLTRGGGALFAAPGLYSIADARYTH